jgi:hypothetical protein
VVRGRTDEPEAVQVSNAGVRGSAGEQRSDKVLETRQPVKWDGVRRWVHIVYSSDAEV